MPQSQHPQKLSSSQRVCRSSRAAEKDHAMCLKGSIPQNLMRAKCLALRTLLYLTLLLFHTPICVYPLGYSYSKLVIINKQVFHEFYKPFNNKLPNAKKGLWDPPLNSIHSQGQVCLPSEVAWSCGTGQLSVCGSPC